MILIHVLSLLITACLFKTYDLHIPIHSNHVIDQFKPTKTEFFKIKHHKMKYTIQTSFKQATMQSKN